MRGNYTARHKAESPKYALRTSFSLLKIVFFMTASTFLLTWPTASLPPPPITLLGLSAAPTHSCLLDLWPWASHGRTIWPPLVSEESLLSPKGEEEVIVNSIWYFVVVFPITFSFMLKAIEYQQGEAIFVFSLQEYVMARSISVVVSLKPQQHFFFFFASFILTWSQMRRWK